MVCARAQVDRVTRAHIFRFGKNSSRVYTEFYSMNMNIKMYETKMRIYKKGESKDWWECEKISRVGVVGRGWGRVRKSLQPPIPSSKPIHIHDNVVWHGDHVLSTCWVTLRIDVVITWAGEGEHMYLYGSVYISRPMYYWYNKSLLFRTNCKVRTCKSSLALPLPLARRIGLGGGMKYQLRSTKKYVLNIHSFKCNL